MGDSGQIQMIQVFSKSRKYAPFTSEGTAPTIEYIKTFDLFASFLLSHKWFENENQIADRRIISIEIAFVLPWNKKKAL